MEEFFPNACIVCNATLGLKQCSSCNMISYCGARHKKKHWSEHKDLCKIITTMREERRVSHLFENLRGVDMLTWRKERMKMSYEAEIRVCRSFKMSDRYIFKYPRSCFVCHESRQELLKNCPGCTSASFCQEHPSSPIHDEDCAKLRECFDYAIKSDLYNPMVNHLGIASVLSVTKPPTAANRPSSSRDFLFNYANPRNPIIPFNSHLRTSLSETFSISLTTFNALKILNWPSVSELTIHAGHVELPVAFINHWETLLHLLPDLKVLKVLVLDYHYDIEEHDKKIEICPKCTSRGKKLIVDMRDLPYAVYMKQSCYKQPDILVYSNLVVPEKDDCPVKASTSLFNAWHRLKCPLILTSFTENDNRLIKQTMKSILGDVDVLFDGDNPFKSLMQFRTYEDGRVGSSNHHMIVLKPGIQKFADPFHSETKRVEKGPTNFFYATACQVCHSANTSVTCNRCKMIFYCTKAHKTEHQSHHKDLCKVILGMMNERGAPHLFDKMKTSDSEMWLRTKVDFMTKAKLKLGRDLLDYEKEIFLFPKTCFVCHESDLSVLKNCGCGVSFCKIHKDDPCHKELCRDLSLAFKLTINGKPEISEAVGVKALKNEGDNNLPSSITTFMDSILLIKKRIAQLVPNSQEILLSDFLTSPLTLLWSLWKLKCKIDSSMVVHVVGATNSEISAQEYWKIILYWLQSLKSLTVVFTGPEISDLSSTRETGLEFPKSSLAGKHLKVESHAIKYEEYFKSDFFLKPDIIVGYNLHIHESEFGISDFNWEETILTLEKVEAPFVLTAGSEKRAQKEHRRFCEHLGKLIDFCCLENSFAGLIPLRDFETERLMYSNQFVIIYDKLFEKGAKSRERNLLSKKMDLLQQNFLIKSKNEELLEKIQRLKVENERLRDEKLIEGIEEVV